MVLINSETLRQNPKILPRELSPVARNQLSNIENLLGGKGIYVTKTSTENFPGAMMMSYEKPHPWIEYKDDSAFTEEGFVHELFHVELAWGFGFPVLGSSKENDLCFDRCVIMLDGQFQHHVFFQRWLTLGIIHIIHLTVKKPQLATCWTVLNQLYNSRQSAKIHGLPSFILGLKSNALQSN